VLGSIGRAEPNSGPLAIAALEGHLRPRVITQNADGLHQAAGSITVREIHGSIARGSDHPERRLMESLARYIMPMPSPWH